MKKKNLKFWQVSEVKISYQNKIKLADSPQVTSSESAANILFANWSDDLEMVESFNVLFLNRANKVKGIFRASKGGVSGTVVDARIIFSAAVKALTCSVILCHNHPSGNLKPSNADIELTKKLAQAGKTLDIQVLDHLILVPSGEFFSFADEGLI